MTTMNTNKLKAGAVSLLLATSMIASATAVSFKDVPETHWAYPSITKLSDIGVINGVGNGLYAPDRTLTNAEFCKMIATRFYGAKVSTDPSYTRKLWYNQILDELDVSSLDIGAEGALFKSGLGILEGTNIRVSYPETGDEMLNPNDTITRYDMAQIIYNMLIKRGAERTRDSETFETIGWTRPELEKLSDTSVVADWDSIPANYRDAVSTCYALGYLTGVDDAGTFAGNQGVTRAAAATIIDRMVQPNRVEIPEGAYRVKPGDPIVTDMWNAAADGDDFISTADGITSHSSFIDIRTGGNYSKLILTKPTEKVAESVYVRCEDSGSMGVIFKGYVDSHSKCTFEVDISNINEISIDLEYGRLSDIYLIR